MKRLSILSTVSLVFLLNSLPINALVSNKNIDAEHPTILTIYNNTNKKYVITVNYNLKQKSEKAYTKAKGPYPKKAQKELIGKQEIAIKAPNNACIGSVKIESNSVFSQLLLSKFKKSKLHDGFCNEHQKWTLYFENGNSKKMSIKKEYIDTAKSKIVKY